MARKVPWKLLEMNYEIQCKGIKEQGYWRSEKMLFMTQEIGVCSQERRAWRARRGSKEKGKKNLTKQHGNRVKRAKQSR